MNHWTMNYIGIPFTSMKCLELVLHVLENEFKKTVRLPYLTDPHDKSKIDPTTVSVEVEESEWTDGDVMILNPESPIIHLGVIVTSLPEVHILHTHNEHIGSTLEPLTRVRRRFTIGKTYRP